MERTSVEKIIEQYSDNFIPRKGGRQQITATKAILLTIWYLANTETFRQIGDRFDVTLSCAHGTVKQVTEFLVRIKHLQKKGIMDVIGAIDGTHFKINRPKLYPEDYCNRKGYHSVVMQGVVNSSMLFVDIYLGVPRSMHDARIFRRSVFTELH
ncbi:hypothetical protein RN001_005499 [Aquatica leii]|uniref:DDE Tnp4 domain-containing protein n=1 Tax=Aquatica leii TaxID=1421715 RepID=A0AAN7SS28_9COLE|nr:hypothetical protein RN001_005499 [Aquatica leii]